MMRTLGSTRHLAATLAVLLVVNLLSGASVGAQSGAIFSFVQSPSPTPQGNVLNAVVALSPSDAWAVGFKGSSNVNESRTLIEHWDGSRWTVVSSPNPGSPLSMERLDVGRHPEPDAGARSAALRRARPARHPRRVGRRGVVHPRHQRRVRLSPAAEDAGPVQPRRLTRGSRPVVRYVPPGALARRRTAR